jgi:bifunctional ADP-heptose synthase (sugar kinase/adenylyltransferase)
VDARRLQELISRFAACRVAVLGDYFLDKYLDVEPGLAEVSIETGRTAHQVRAIRCAPGAAGTVVNNLAALQAGTIHALGFTGDDGEGYELRRGLSALGCQTDGLLTVPERFTPTYLKPRDGRNAALSGEHDRYDTKNRDVTPPDVQEQVLERLERLVPDVDAVVVLDQVEEADCGIVTGTVRDGVARLAARSPRTIFWADSRRRIGSFRNVTIKVNADEAVREADAGGTAADGEAGIRHAIARLAGRTGRPVFVTAGDRGIWVGDGRGAVHVPAVRAPAPIDPTGAGDSATAGAVLALCAGATTVEAALVANLVASVTIQQLATTGTASPAQLGARLETWRSQR